MALKVILDTDAGDDIDDLYALALILSSPELELVGITTVFGNTPARARLVQTLLKVCGREDIPVAAGCGGVLSPRVEYGGGKKKLKDRVLTPSAFDYLTDIKPPQFPCSLPEKDLPPLHPTHGVNFLIETLLNAQEEIVLLTIGAMTNVATALIMEPGIIRKISRIYAMAGCYFSPQVEWNICCDPIAARIVFDSGIPIIAVGLDVTLKCVFNEQDLMKLYGAGTPLLRKLTEATRLWCGSTGRKFPVLHDPLAVCLLLRENLVEMERGRVFVEIEGEKGYGLTLFEKNEQGIHQVGKEVKAREVIDLWMERCFNYG